MEFTWNEPNPVPKKCVETGGSNEKEENKETEVAWVKYEVKSPELQEKLKAEARSSLHLKKVRFLPTKYCKKKNSKSSSDFLNECVHKWHFAKSHCWWIPLEGWYIQNIRFSNCFSNNTLQNHTARESISRICHGLNDCVHKDSLSRRRPACRLHRTEHTTISWLYIDSIHLARCIFYFMIHPKSQD